MEDVFEVKLKEFIASRGIAAIHMHFEQSCHSVEEAAKAANAKREDFVKNVCMVDEKGNVIVCIVKGEDRASAALASKLLGCGKLRLATAQEMLEKTGYPAGGTPSFGYAATFLIDERVMEREFVWTGGGSENALVKVAPSELIKANGGKVAHIRK